MMCPSETSSTQPHRRSYHPIIARWGIRAMEDFTVEELARLPQKRDGWIGQRAPQTERTRRRPWVMQPNTAHPA
jgi:hypothetical protein